MKKFLAISLILTAPAVLANKVKVLEVSPPAGFAEAPVIHVFSSDGESWDSVDRTRTTGFKVGLQAECRSGIKRKKQPYRGALHVPGFERVGPTLPADAMIPEAAAAYAQFRFADGAGQTTSAPQLCTDELARRLARYPDQTKHQLMAKGFNLEAPAAFTAHYTLTCLGTGLGGTDLQTQTVAVNSRITCKASDLAAAYVPTVQIQISKIKLDPMITNIAVQPAPEEFIGPCPANVVFSAALTASRPGKVSYRVISGSGSISPAYELVFDQAGTLQIPKWQRSVAANTPPDLPFTEPTPASIGTAAGPVLPAANTQGNPSAAEAPVGRAGVKSLSERQAMPATLSDLTTSATSPEPPAFGAATDKPDTSVEDTGIQAAETIPGSDAAVTETPPHPTKDAENVPDNNWDFVGWEQIEILAPEQMTGNQARFAVACAK